jgi:hypothetical protein
MRRIAYLLAATCLLSGCGVLTKQDLKPQAPTLTHGRFVYLAEHICARDLRHDKRFRTPTNPTQFDHEFQAVIKSYERALFDLRGLAPPAADAESFRHLLAAFNLQDLLGNNLLQASELGQARRLKSIARKLDRNDKNLKSRARALGLRACAKE